MKVTIRADSVEIDGYVNAVERVSNVLNDGAMPGPYLERVSKGAFKKALRKNHDVKILLNHNKERELGSTAKGNLELDEDSIGLHARAVITDKEVIEKARRNKLVGWSFGFTDAPNGVDEVQERGYPCRVVNDLDLREVSILDNGHIPAYDGTSIMTRETKDDLHLSNVFKDEIITREIIEEKPKEEKTGENNETIENKAKPKYNLYRNWLDIEQVNKRG